MGFPPGVPGSMPSADHFSPGGLGHDRGERARRFTHGEMTQAQLAERVGVTRQTVIAIEQGRYSPSLEIAFQIARVFGCRSARCFSTPTARKGRDEGPKPPDIGGKKTVPAASLTARPAPSFPYYP